MPRHATPWLLCTLRSLFLHLSLNWFLLLRISLNAVVAQRSAHTAFMSVIASVNMNAIYYFFATLCFALLCAGMMSDFVHMLWPWCMKMCEKTVLHCLDSLGSVVGLAIVMFLVSQPPLVVWNGEIFKRLALDLISMYICFLLVRALFHSAKWTFAIYPKWFSMHSYNLSMDLFAFGGICNGCSLFSSTVPLPK